MALGWDVLSRDTFLSLYIDRYSYGFNFLGDLLFHSPLAGHLHASVDAVGLAFTALYANEPHLVLLAKRRYVCAIRTLRTAIDSAQQSASDGTGQSVSNEIIQSVLLLDVFEKMAALHQGAASFSGSWLSHILGALHMVRTHPNVDFSDPTTRELASRTVLGLTISCGAAKIPIPASLKALQKDLDRYVRNAKWTFICLLSRVVDLQAAMRDPSITSADILSQVRDLDEQLSIGESKVPRSWLPRKVYVTSPVILDNYYDVYPSHYATQVFNAFRIVRLQLNGIIRDIEPSELVADQNAQLTRNICAAVPQFILPGARAENTMPFSPLQVLECCGLLTSLSIAAQMTTDTHVRGWILDCLRHMEQNGVKMARNVAHVLKFSPEADYWTVFTMVGCYAITA